MSPDAPRRVYVAGPMTHVPQFNFPAFDDAAADLRARGIDVTSPAELDDEEVRRAALASPDGAPGSGSPNGETWGDFLARDVKLIADDVDGIVVLDGWERSRGARLETFVARLSGKPILRYPTLQPVPDAEIDAAHAPGSQPQVQGEVRIVNERTGGAKGAKPQRFGLLPWVALALIAEVYDFGSKKYEDDNWRKGYDWHLSFDALIRHLGAFWGGEELDPESGLPHLAHAGFHVLALLTFSTETRYAELDDRYTTRLAA
jgi:hypothetical protein